MCECANLFLRKVVHVLSSLLELIGVITLFLGMCMETEDVCLFVAQILMIVFGIVLFHIGLCIENLKIERIKTDMRVERIRRRKSAA